MLLGMASTYSESFKRYGATLRNNLWSVSAFSISGELVLSLWENQLSFDRERRTLVYLDKLSGWKGNRAGREELRTNLNLAFSEHRAVRIVISHPLGPEAKSQVGQVDDESQIQKTFSVRPDLVGTITEFDGDLLQLEFKQQV